MDKVLGYDVEGYKTYIASYDKEGFFMQDWVKNYKTLSQALNDISNIKKEYKSSKLKIVIIALRVKESTYANHLEYDFETKQFNKVYDFDSPETPIY